MNTDAMNNWLKEHGACKAGLDWAVNESGADTLERLWETLCALPEKRAWLIWFANAALTKRQRCAFSARCVRETKLHDGRNVYDLLMDDRSRKAVEVAERYSRGEATEEERSASADYSYASYAAYAAAAYAADAANAAYAAAYAARAAAYAAAASAAAYAARAAASAAAYAAASAADAKKQHAEWLREINPFNGNDTKGEA